MTTKTTRPKSDNAAQPPVTRVRVGRINAAIWRHTTEDGLYYAATFEKRILGKDGEWRSVYGYGEADLLALAKAADLAHHAIRSLKATDVARDLAGEDEGEDDGPDDAPDFVDDDPDA